MSFKKYHQDRIRNKKLAGIAFTFGRFQPCTKGHSENFQVMAKFAKKNLMDSVVFTSNVQNQKKNPLSAQDKVYYLKKIVPKGTRVSEDGSLKNAFEILEHLIKNLHYKRIAFFVGGDRKSDFDALLKYTKLWGKGEVSLEIITSGERKAGISGTQMREYVKNNDFKSFNKMLPKGLTKQDQIDLFSKLEVGLGIK